MWNVASSGTPETRQHFFLFSRFFYFYPWLSPLSHDLRRRAKAHHLAERVEVCQYFFKDFLNFLEPRIQGVVRACLAKEGGSSVVCLLF
jgi:hypothetical protein